MRDDGAWQEELDQFMLRYGSEEACVEALFKARWPQGFRCPRCASRHAYAITSRKLYECADCKYQVSVTAGTVFSHTRTSLTKWFAALFLLSRPSGISAVMLQQILQTTYKTAWSILTKIRYAMSQTVEASLLTGIVRVNAAVYGKTYIKSIGDLQGVYSVVIGASVDREGEPEQVKIQLLPELHPDEYHGRRRATEAFRDCYVDPKLVDVQMVHKRFDSNRFKPLLSLVHKATRWVHTTFGGIRIKHLQAYLDEFSYRHHATKEARVEESNGLPARSAVFDRMLQLCSSHPSMTYAELVW